MKRELLENVKVQPYTSGDAIDRAVSYTHLTLPTSDLV